MHKFVIMPLIPCRIMKRVFQNAFLGEGGLFFTNVMRLSTKFFTTSKFLLSVPRVKIPLLRHLRKEKFSCFFPGQDLPTTHGAIQDLLKDRDASFR